MKTILIQPFIILAGIATTIASLGLSVFSPVVVFKRDIFVPLAIAETALCGVIIGTVVGINFYLTAIVFSLITILLLFSIKTNKSLPQETVIAIVYVFASALSIIALSKSPVLHSQATDVLFGNVLTVGQYETWFSLITTLISLTTLFLLYGKFVFAFSDIETAKSCGLNVGLLNFIFYSILSLIITASIKILGLLLTFSYLLLPTTVASLVSCRSLKSTTLFGVISSLISTWIGFILSVYLDTPTGPTIVITFLLVISVIYFIKKIFKL